MARFEDVFSDETKRGHKIQTSEYLPLGKYPIIDQGQAQIAGYTDLEDGLFTDVPAIIFGDHTRIIKYVDYPFFLGADGVKVLKTKLDGADYKYLFYCLQNAKIPNTGYNRHFKWLKEIDIPLPPLEEQRRIADILDKVSDLIAKRRAQLDKLDLLVKARFVEMFGGNRPTERLECFSTLITKGASPKWQGIDYEEDGTLFITSENVQAGYIDFEKRKYLNNRINKIQPRSILQRNDILINIVGASIGRAAIFESDELANINQAVALVRIDSKKLNLKFLITFLNSSQALELYSAMKKGGARDNLSLKNIADLPIPIVPITSQKQFADYIFQTDEAKLRIHRSLGKLEVLKKVLMQQYFG